MSYIDAGHWDLGIIEEHKRKGMGMKLFSMGKFEEGYEVEKAFTGVMIEATEDELIKIKELLGKEVAIREKPEEKPGHLSVCFNGLRRNLGDAYKELFKSVSLAMPGMGWSHKKDMREAMDDLRRWIGFLYCCYESDNPDMDMSDEIDSLPELPESEEE